MIFRPFARNLLLLTSGALLGLALGAWSGQLAVQHQQYAETGQMAASYIARSDVLDSEAVDALAEIQQSIVPMCAPRDLARLRNLVISSHFLKVASRVRDGRIVCSSSLGVVEPPVELPPPDFVTGLGRSISLNGALHGMPGTHAMIISQGSASVVINRDAYASLVDPRLTYAVVADYAGKRVPFITRDTPIDLLDGQPLVTGRPVQLQGRRYEVQCSHTHAGCMVATLRNPEGVANSPVFIGFSLLGLLAGIGGGLSAGSAIARLNSLGRRLRQALRNGDLEVVYQPIVRLRDDKRTGAEALLRWRDTQGQPISPDVFIAIAEQDGFISDVTRYVIRHVLSELGDALRLRPGFCITINVSVQDLLDGSFAPFVAQALKNARLPPASIAFEITERSTAAHAAIGKGIEQLRRAGHRVYIDDFGADYSSLSYLAQLHVDAIKLDRSFTRALQQEQAGDSIAPQIVAMAHALGLTLVVEGIEQPEQAQYYLALDQAVLGQGWLFGRPQPAHALFADPNDAPPDGPTPG